MSFSRYDNDISCFFVVVFFFVIFFFFKIDISCLKRKKKLKIENSLIKEDKDVQFYIASLAVKNIIAVAVIIIPT